MRKRVMNTHNRDGLSLIAVLVGMGVATLIVLTTLQSSLRQRRQLSREIQMEQTRWLMEAGVGRAIELDKPLNAPAITLDPPLANFENASVEVTTLPNAAPSDKRLRITAIIDPMAEEKTIQLRTKQQIEIEIEIKTNDPELKTDPKTGE